MINKLKQWMLAVRAGANVSSKALPRIQTSLEEMYRAVLDLQEAVRGGSSVHRQATLASAAASLGRGHESPEQVHKAITAVWDSYADEEYRKDQSHWRGAGRWSDDTKWQNLGKRSLSRFKKSWAHAGRAESDLRNLTILEWGPGGGTNAFAFREVAKRYHGVDISKKNLEEAQRLMTAEGRPEYFHPVLITGSPATARQMIDEPIDGFLSTAVFQHFPSRDYGKEVLQVIRQICKPGAVGFIQIRFTNSNTRYAGIESIDEYQKKHIRATSYPLDDFWNLLGETGFLPFSIDDLTTENNQATFYMIAK